MPNPATLDATLAHFTGSDTCYCHPLSNLLYTDGVRYLAHTAAAYWLIDAIASHQRNPALRAESLQIWRLTRTGTTARLTCSHDILAGRPIGLYLTQDIPFTDFPLATITLYLENGLLMLPSER